MAKTVSIRELCEKLDVSDVAAGKLVMKGIVIRVCRGRYDLDLSLKNYIRHLREIAAGRGTSEESGLNLPDESARLKAAQRENLELKIALFKGEVIRVADVAPVWARIAIAVRNAMLAIRGGPG